MITQVDSGMNLKTCHYQYFQNSQAMSRYILLSKCFVPKLQYYLLVCVMLFGNIIMGQNPNWTAPNSSQYNYIATMTAVVKLEGVATSNVNDKLAVFVGNEIRGLSYTAILGNKLYFFTSIVSNQVTDTMTIKYYDAAIGLVYTHELPFIFKANQIYGNIDHPSIYDFYLEGLPPLAFGIFPTFEGSANCPIPPIYLNDYILNRRNKTAIVWSIQNNPNLITNLNADTLHISGATGFLGDTILWILVHDTSVNGLMYAFNIQVTISPNLPPLEWNGLPHQGIVQGDTFDIVVLDSFVVGNQGNNLKYDYFPLITEASPPVSQPNWSVANNNYPMTMTITAKVQYTPKLQFGHPQDRLVAISPTVQVLGVANRDEVTGLFFLAIGKDMLGDSIQLMFYSGLKKEVLVHRPIILFDPGLILGNIEVPYTIDFAPIIPHILADNKCEFEIIDTTFIGTELFSFFVKDTLNPICFFDSTSVSLCIVSSETELLTYYRDADGDGLGDPLVFIKACQLPSGYVTNNLDCDDNDPNNTSNSIVISENSGVPNDGYICASTPTTLSVSNTAQSYLWSTGQTTQSIAINPSESAIYMVTISVGDFCSAVLSTNIYVEGSIVTNSQNTGFGTLRNVIACALDGSNISYDLPMTDHTLLTQPLDIDKNITISGTTTQNPKITLNYADMLEGIVIHVGNTLSLYNIDLKLINQDLHPVFSGTGEVKILGTTKISDE